MREADNRGGWKQAKMETTSTIAELHFRAREKISPKESSFVIFAD
jgi:hypothetical protein